GRGRTGGRSVLALQFALRLQEHLPELFEHRRVRLLPHAARLGLQQAFRDAVQGPRVGLLEELPVGGVQDVGLGELVVHPVGEGAGADRLGAGGVADVRLGGGAAERADGGDHAAVVLEVVVGVGDVVFAGVGVLGGDGDPPVRRLHVVPGGPAVEFAAVGVAAPLCVHRGAVG